MRVAAAVVVSVVCGLVCVAAVEAAEAGRKVSPKPADFGIRIQLPESPKHPVVACTPEELARLKAAYTGKGPEHDAVAGVVQSAQRRIGQPVEFPPRGGQHNQWYQCEKCQIGLKTLDATHHQCPRCKTTYRGEPYDDVIFSKVHDRNLSDACDAAWAYAITGEEKYAAFAREVLVGYANRYKQYPYHDNSFGKDHKPSRSGGHLVEQTLGEASSLAGKIAPAYDLIRGSSSLSAEDREAIENGLLRPMLENIGKNNTGMSNWQTWHNAAMLWGGAALGDEAWVRRAIEDPKNGFLYQMQASVSDEGMWYENSWGYHFYTLSAMVDIIEGARRLKIDLWSHPVLKKMFVVAGQYAMPDGSLPRFGDDVHTTIGHASRMLEFAYHAYRDPAMLPLLPRRASWDSVMLGRTVADQPAPVPPESVLLPSAGHAILRVRGQAGLAAAFTFGPYGGFHGHFDKLSFVFFGHNKELGVDPGRAKSQAYRLPIHTQWYKATISHNTVVVDCASQKPASGKLESFGASEYCAAAVARCDDAYPGVGHRRLLCLTPYYLLTFDDLDASAARRFDWIYHNRGTEVACGAAKSDEPSGEKYPGWDYVQNVRYGKSGDLIRARFVDGNVATHLTLAPSPDTEIRTGDGVGGSVTERVPLVMATRRGKQAQFAAVLEPVAKGASAAVESVVVQSQRGGVRITVQRGATSDVFLLNAQGKVQVSSGGSAVLTTK